VTMAKNWKDGIVEVGLNTLELFDPTFRFPVLVSWDFTCTGEGGFERLMNKLEVGLLGTLADDQPPPIPEVAPTGHVALSHRTRRGESARSWYRGPLVPQPTPLSADAGALNAARGALDGRVQQLVVDALQINL